jgi:hypothetical protein
VILATSCTVLRSIAAALSIAMQHTRHDTIATPGHTVFQLDHATKTGWCGWISAVCHSLVFLPCVTHLYFCRVSLTCISAVCHSLVFLPCVTHLYFCRVSLTCEFLPCVTHLYHSCRTTTCSRGSSRAHKAGREPSVLFARRMILPVLTATLACTSVWPLEACCWAIVRWRNICQLQHECIHSTIC